MNDDIIKTLQATVAARLSFRAEAEKLSDNDREALGVELISEVLAEHAQRCVSTGQRVLSVDEEDEVAQFISDALFGLGRLQRLLDDPSIENIDANGCDRVFVRYSDGTTERVGPIADTDEDLIELIRRAAARLGTTERRFDLGSPQLNQQLPDGSRLFAVMAVSQRPCLSIRIHRYLQVDLDDLVRLGTISPLVRSFLGAATASRQNMVVSGATGAGKTTLMRAISSDIPPSERIVTVEDSRELGLERFEELHPNVVSLEVREQNIEGEGGIDMRALVRCGLRMSPDRVMVGESRGPEIIDMLNAMSQGNNGSLSTIHANSSQGVFSRIATYAIQSEERLPLEATNLLIANSINLVIFVDRDRSGNRVISSIREVTGADGAMVVSNEIFRPDHEGKAAPGAPMTTRLATELADFGYDDRMAS